MAMKADARLKALNERIGAALLDDPRLSDSIPVFGEGRAERALMVIGEAPGRDETRLGRPFVGKAGTFFISALEEATGFKREAVYITNAVKVWPHLKTKRLKTRPPTDDERAFFLPFLEEEIEAVAPEVIIAVGKTAFRALLPVGEFVPGRWASYRGMKVMPVYHPAYILRRRKRMEQGIEELKEALLEVKKALS
ncbi:MAG: uracil-DNA glycosylase [Deltaproteobacteria bacterium]|nr:uracil-DNA glycosylase [Deltaproteobacteria bacterium]